VPKIYVDSNVFIIGRMIRESNSRLILEAAERKIISVIISEDTIREVVEFFRRNLGKTQAAVARYYMLMMLNAEVVWRSDYNEQIEECKRDISDPDDSPHLSAALKAKSDFIVSTNRHFLRGAKRIKVITPKQMVEALSLKSYKTDY